MDIKIVICLILICLIPSSSATDTLWTAKSSGFIGFNESLSYENYLVKATVLDGTVSSISVYENNVLLETSNFGMNDIKIYTNISITLLGIRGRNSWISISKFENKEFWRSLKSAQLKWGESYSIDNYSFMINTIGRDSVNLTISNKTGTKTEEFFAGDERYFETFKMRLTNINRTGFIDIDFFTNKLPDYKTEVFPNVKAQIYTDKDEYFPDEPIKVSITATSDLTLNLIGITVETNPNAEVSQDNFSITDFSGKRTFETIITQQPMNSTLTINARLDVRDYSGNSHVIDVSKDVSITPEIAIIKRVPADTDDEIVPVQLYIYNSGLSNRSVSIRDMIPEELIAKSFEWELDIGPKNSRTLEYNLTPSRPGLYFLPSATAKTDNGTTASKRVKMTMHMPYLTMAKSIEYNESNTIVKVVTTNIGDRPSQVRIWDNIPSGNNVLSGETTFSGKLENGENVEISYYLQGEIENLPAAQASYLDIRGVTRQTLSNTIEFGKSVERTQQETSESTKPLNVASSDLVLFMISSFVAIAGIVTGAALIAYLITKTLR
ncbi:MAG: hypothetical protein Q7J35_19010 [Candidatus Methanoperedens sp.]|nr:hypothetical protein [Candidatus Methanoperedens sp.]